MKDNLLEPGDELIALVHNPFSAGIDQGDVFSVSSVSEDGCRTSNGWWIPREVSKFDGKIRLFGSMQLKPKRVRKNRTKAFVLK